MRILLMLLICLRVIVVVVVVEGFFVVVLYYFFVNLVCFEGEIIVSIKCIRYCFFNINIVILVNYVVYKLIKKLFYG